MCSLQVRWHRGWAGRMHAMHVRRCRRRRCGGRGPRVPQAAPRACIPTISGSTGGHVSLTATCLIWQESDTPGASSRSWPCSRRRQKCMPARVNALRSLLRRVCTTSRVHSRIHWQAAAVRLPFCEPSHPLTPPAPCSSESRFWRASWPSAPQGEWGGPITLRQPGRAALQAAAHAWPPAPSRRGTCAAPGSLHP